MTNDYRKGWQYRERTDANFRERRKYGSRIRLARVAIIKPDAKCQNKAQSSHAGPLELHHRNGDLSGKSGYAAMCRKHNREDAGQAPGKMTKPYSVVRL